MAAPSEFSVGLGNGRASSRVLKPPGGGHSNIFAEPAAELPKARPKYNQQNSSNLNYCMNTVDPNEVVAKINPVKTPTEPPKSNGIHHNGNAPTNGNVIQPAAAAPVQKPPSPPVEKPVPTVTATAPAPQKPPTPTSLPISNPATAVTAPSSPPSRTSTKVRQPPGGFSAGLW